MKAKPTMTPEEEAAWVAGIEGPAVVAGIEHGRFYSYAWRGCRCAECRAVYNWYYRERRRRRRETLRILGGEQ